MDQQQKKYDNLNSIIVHNVFFFVWEMMADCRRKLSCLNYGQYCIFGHGIYINL